MPDTDFVIVGSGFGGSILAMIARRLGYRVILLERGQHPRFAIGESASPLAGILIEQLADRYDLPRLRPLSAFGTWQRAYPRIVCGLKRGFTFFKHQAGCQYKTAPDRSNQLFVAASPNDELSDTHWLRSDVDQFLVNEAIAAGTDYLDHVQLDRVEWCASGDPVLVGTRHGQMIRVRARFVVDASGPRGFLGRALGITDAGFAGYPATQALFSHFTGVARCDEMHHYGPMGRGCGRATVQYGGATCEGVMRAGPSDRTLAPSDRTLAPSHLRTLAPQDPPYPIDDAALHHVFDGGWMWVLRFGNGVTSAGVAVEDWLAQELRLADGEAAWDRLLARFPSVAAQFAEARPIRPFTWMPRLASRAACAAGERWAMLPSAAAFIDPLFSTGIPLTLLGIERLARAIEAEAPVGSAVSGLQRFAHDYSRRTLDDADRTAAFIAGSYAGFRRFPTFAAFSMFYFAAASYSEMARRLDSPRAPRAFLCGDDAVFASALERLSPARRNADDDSYEHDVAAAIAPLNVAGLCDADKRNWYGVDLEDTIRGAAKLGLTSEDVRQRLVANLEPGTPNPEPNLNTN